MVTGPVLDLFLVGGRHADRDVPPLLAARLADGAVLFTLDHEGGFVARRPLALDLTDVAEIAGEPGYVAVVGLDRLVELTADGPVGETVFEGGPLRHAIGRGLTRGAFSEESSDWQAYDLEEDRWERVALRGLRGTSVAVDPETRREEAWVLVRDGDAIGRAPFDGSLLGPVEAPRRVTERSGVALVAAQGPVAATFGSGTLALHTADGDSIAEAELPGAVGELEAAVTEEDSAALALVQRGGEGGQVVLLVDGTFARGWTHTFVEGLGEDARIELLGTGLVRGEHPDFLVSWSDGAAITVAGVQCVGFGGP